MNGRDRLAEIPAGTEFLRAVRHLPAEELSSCSTAELVAAARWLRAASYSCSEGARHLEGIARRRDPAHRDNRRDPSCSSDPKPTTASTGTAPRPTATQS